MDAGIPKYDFDLNIPYMEEEEEEGFPQLLDLNNTHNTQDKTKTGEDNGKNEVPLAVDSNSLANTFSGVSDDDDDNDDEEEEEEVKPPLRFIDFLHVDGYQGITMAGRRRYSRRGRPHAIDMNKICTNIRCKSRKTPMWRTGPLGSRTLCNACGIYYRKQMRSAEKGIGTGRISYIIIYGDGSASSSGSEE